MSLFQIQEEVYPVEERSPAQRLADEVMHAVYSLHRYNGDVMSSSDGQITVSADAVSSSDGQITVSADAASSSDGQITVSVDAVSSSDGQITVPADAVSSSDGQITVSADAVSSSDGQITVSVDAVSSSDGQITVPADAVLRTVSRCCSCDSYTSEEIQSVVITVFDVVTPVFHWSYCSWCVHSSVIHPATGCSPFLSGCKCCTFGARHGFSCSSAVY